MAQAAWDPAQYLKFSDERLRPALDLLARVPLEAPGRVVDLGCGAGNVTAALAQRFPRADITGIDGSEAMLAKARTALPSARFMAADIATWQPDAAPDLIYSNAALHWLADHTALFARLMDVLAPGGVLAVQMPGMHDAPLRRLQSKVAASGPWAQHLAESVPARDILSAGEYWDLLSPNAGAIDMWETTYMHVLRGEDPVLEWASGSSLRPFLDRLPADLVTPFRDAYAEAVRPHYPRRADGATLLPFRRLFMVAVRA